MIRALVLAFLAVAPALAAEPCRTHGSATASPIVFDADHPSGLMASIPVVVKLHGVTEESLEGLPASCDRGAFRAGKQRYRLTGEDGDPYTPRRAVAEGAAAPMAVLTEVFDLGPALSAPPEPGAEPRGLQTRYALATAFHQVMVVWKVYDGVPGDALLKADMADALGGKALPVLRFDMRGGQAQVLAK